MALPPLTTPPTSAEPYLISQLEGEKITIPGSKGVFRIMASALQTQNKIAVFSSGAVLSDAPGFHYHEHAHDVFLVTKGYLKLWNGDKCRLMTAGDFAYIPPTVVHNPEMLGPHTELLGLIAPGDWIDFFRYVGETNGSLIVPETDDRNIGAEIFPKIMAAKDRFDVKFVREYDAPKLGDWEDSENQLPAADEKTGFAPGYYIRSGMGPRYMAGGVLSRPLVTAKQCGGKFAIASIESSKAYPASPLFAKPLVFEDVDHCFCVQEGVLSVDLNGAETLVREGETVVVPSGTAFKMAFKSKYVRLYSFASGDGIESLVQEVGSSFAGAVLPDKAPEFDTSQLERIAKGFSIRFA